MDEIHLAKYRWLLCRRPFACYNSLVPWSPYHMKRDWTTWNYGLWKKDVTELTSLSCSKWLKVCHLCHGHSSSAELVTLQLEVTVGSWQGNTAVPTHVCTSFHNESLTVGITYLRRTLMFHLWTVLKVAWRKEGKLRWTFLKTKVLQVLSAARSWKTNNKKKVKNCTRCSRTR